MLLLIGFKTYLLVLFIRRLFINCPAHIWLCILSNIGIMCYAFWKRWKELVLVYSNVLQQHFPQKNRGKPRTFPVRISGIWTESWIRHIAIRRTPPLNRVARPIFVTAFLAWGCIFRLVKSSVLWNITPCSPLKVNRPFGRTYRLHLPVENKTSKKPAFTLVSCSSYSSTLNMKAVCSSETSVDFQRTTQHCIPEDSILYDDRCENIKFHIWPVLGAGFWMCTSVHAYVL
jgi:hypothetical protein